MNIVETLRLEYLKQKTELFGDFDGLWRRDLQPCVLENLLSVALCQLAVEPLHCEREAEVWPTACHVYRVLQWLAIMC